MIQVTSEISALIENQLDVLFSALEEVIGEGLHHD